MFLSYEWLLCYRVAPCSLYARGSGMAGGGAQEGDGHGGTHPIENSVKGICIKDCKYSQEKRELLLKGIILLELICLGGKYLYAEQF